MTATTDPRKACLVLHGKAAARDDVREAVRAVRKDGYRVDVRVTWETGDASRSAREATETGTGSSWRAVAMGPSTRWSRE
jgi:diacylglycerol kinase family enzyme